MTVTPRQIRDAIATALSGAADLSGWVESVTPAVRLASAPREKLHKVYGVEIEATNLIDTRPRRQSEGAYCETIVLVWWAMLIRGDGPVLDYQTALDAEKDIVAAVVNETTRTAGFALNFYGVPERSFVPEGHYLLTSARFRVLHHYPLE